MKHHDNSSSAGTSGGAGEELDKGLIYFENLSPYHTPSERAKLVKHWVYGFKILCSPVTNLCRKNAWKAMKQPIDEVGTNQQQTELHTLSVTAGVAASSWR